MPGVFILSLDCEGNWGIADQAPERPWLSREVLEEAYSSLLCLLDHLGIPATFAFVGAFASTDSVVKSSEFNQLAGEVPYLRAALNAFKASSDGWIGDWALQAVTSARTAHERALHGMSHAPWAGLSRESAERELQLQRLLPFKPATFIYPRNAVAHADLLAEYGFAGYRTAAPRRSRLTSLLSEFDINVPSQPGAGGAICPIPSGYFVNWQRGPRRLVPHNITIIRARRLLAHATSNARVAHYWTHPENIASAPRTLLTLRGVLEEAARFRDAGKIDIITQLEYCRRLHSTRCTTTVDPRRHG